MAGLAGGRPPNIAPGPPASHPRPGRCFRPEVPLRDRARILSSLEGVYREAFDAAKERDDKAAMERLDFDFQRDQVWFEVLLDLRDLLRRPPSAASAKETKEESVAEQAGNLLEKARALRRFTGR